MTDSSKDSKMKTPSNKKATNTTSAIKILTAVGFIGALPFALALFYTFQVVAFGGGGGEDPTLWQLGVEQADKVFAANGLCPVHNHECLDKNTMYWSGTMSSYKIYIYGVNDQKILEQVSQSFVDEYKTLPNMKRLDIVAYPLTKSEDMKLPLLQRPVTHEIFSLSVRKDE